jgi:hypothetical protein
LAQLNSLILSGRIGKHTDSEAIELVASTQAKTDCQQWHTDGWRGYEPVLRDEQVEHYSWHFEATVGAHLWNPWAADRTLASARESMRAKSGSKRKSPYVWLSATSIGRRQHSCLGTRAAQRAELTARPWTWNHFATYPTLS